MFNITKGNITQMTKFIQHVQNDKIHTYIFFRFFQDPTPNREYPDLTYISHLDSSEQPTLFAQPLQQHSEPLNQI